VIRSVTRQKGAAKFMSNICLKCSSKLCRNTDFGTLDICDYGVAFYNDNGQILKKEERLTLQHMSQNLRHELNKVLQTIISEAIKIDPTISTKKIEIENPASRIVGGIVVIDQFIETEGSNLRLTFVW
jgi:hypothetical protein